MRSTILILSLVAAIVAEAPYHLPRPAVHSPIINYQPAPAPILRPQPPPVHHHAYHQQAPQQNYIQGSGYHYQQPIQQPIVHYQPAPQPQYQPAPQVQYQPQVRYQPQVLPQPLPNYYTPAPAPVSQPISYPSTSYGVPQAQIAPRPIVAQPLPNYIQPQPAPLPINYHQQNNGYSYVQPLSQAPVSLPLQSQSVSSNFGTTGVSSYQADSNLYSTGHTQAQAQTHSEALDSLVVNHVQNIIKDNEHSVARDAGYLSLVSGVSLENVKPSVEISSFVHSAPLTSIEQGTSSLSTSSVGSAALAVSAPSQDYGLPTVTANSQSSGTSFSANNKPSSSYGVPN